MNLHICCRRMTFTNCSRWKMFIKQLTKLSISFLFFFSFPFDYFSRTLMHRSCDHNITLAILHSFNLLCFSGYIKKKAKNNTSKSPAKFPRKIQLAFHSIQSVMFTSSNTVKSYFTAWCWRAHCVTQHVIFLFKTD